MSGQDRSGIFKPLTWSEVGTPPKGLTLSSSGLLSGTVAKSVKAGTYTIKVQVIDSTKGKVQTATASLKLTIAS